MKTILSLLALISCSSTQETPYQKSSNQSAEGLSISKQIDGTYLSTFQANSRTSKSKARDFSILGAIEKCKNEKKLVQVIQTKDQSNSKTYIYNQFYTYPTQSNFITRNDRQSAIARPRTTHSYSYPVKVEFPKISTSFKCNKRIFAFPFTFTSENISRDLVHPYTKDFRGGVYLKKINLNKSFLKEGDVIIALNNYRVDKAFDIKEKVLTNPQILKSGILKARIIRGNKLKEVTISLKNITKQTQLAQNDFIKEKCLKMENKPAVCL